MKDVLALVRAQLGESSELAVSFADFLDRSAPENPEQIIEEVDQSDYSMADWIEAVLAFDRWLESRGTPLRPFAQMVGYIHCCALTNSPALELPSLESVVIQALEEFGFDYLDEFQN